MVQSAGWLCYLYRAKQHVPLGTIVLARPMSLSPPPPPCRVTGRANSEGRYPVQPLKQEKVLVTLGICVPCSLHVAYISRIHFVSQFLHIFKVEDPGKTYLILREKFSRADA
jgi:hypothetical protein